MTEKHAPLTKTELDILATGITDNNDQWKFLQDNASRISLPEDGRATAVEKVEKPSSTSVKTGKTEKKVKKVPAQIPSAGKLPDVDVSDEYWNK